MPFFRSLITQKFVGFPQVGTQQGGDPAIAAQLLLTGSYIYPGSEQRFLIVLRVPVSPALGRKHALVDGASGFCH